MTYQAKHVCPLCGPHQSWGQGRLTRHILDGVKIVHGLLNVNGEIMSWLLKDGKAQG